MTPPHPPQGVETYLFDFSIFLQDLPPSSLEEKQKRKRTMPLPAETPTE